MKFKKTSYLLLIVLMLFIGINGVSAKKDKTCYYLADDGKFKSSITFTWGFDSPSGHRVEAYSKVYIDKIGAKVDHDDELLINWIDCFWDNSPRHSDVVFDDYYENSSDANSDGNPDCPKYLVFEECGTFRVWATESETKAQKASKEINDSGKCNGYYGKNDIGDGKGAIDAETYYGGFANLDDNGTNAPLTCQGLLGDKNDDGDKNDVGNDKVASIRYIIDTIMGYVRIIVPLLIIVLGMLDLGKAVVAGKEDAMKQAQKTFVKRIIAGVCVFFSPLLINIIMDLAEVVWGTTYEACRF